MCLQLRGHNRVIIGRLVPKRVRRGGYLKIIPIHLRVTISPKLSPYSIILVIIYDKNMSHVANESQVQ